MTDVTDRKTDKRKTHDVLVAIRKKSVRFSKQFKLQTVAKDILYLTNLNATETR